MPMDERASPPLPPAAAPAVAASPRWMRVLLVVSLALNLLIAGAVAGLALRGGPTPAATREVSFGPFAAALSPEDRADLRRAFIARGIADGGGRRMLREDIRSLMGALRADPYDAQTLGEVFDRMAERMSGRVETGLSLIEERIATMDDSERAAFTDRLERELRRVRRRDNAGREAPAP
jgi:uncharacterized membrane protein